MPIVLSDKEIMRRRSKIAQLRAQKMPVNVIAFEMGMSDSALREFIRRHASDLVRPRNAKQNKEYEARKKRAVELYRSGLAIDDIVDQLGVSKQTFYRYIEGVRRRGSAQNRADDKSKTRAADIRILCTRGGYSASEAKRIVDAPKKKIRLGVPPRGF